MAGKTAPKLDGYEVLVCVTGGIACYKSADLTSKLVQAGANVTAAMTDSATRFIAPVTFQTLTGRQAFTSMWQAGESFDPQHLSLTERADMAVIAPATANIMAKMAAGIADDLVSALALSAHGACEILIAPAMNTRMWEAPATQANLKRLTGWGVHVIGPGEGFLACRSFGKGRMAEPGEILQAVADILLKNPPKAKSRGKRRS